VAGEVARMEKTNAQITVLRKPTGNIQLEARE
jgi:hypothetical protein